MEWNNDQVRDRDGYWVGACRHGDALPKSPIQYVRNAVEGQGCHNFRDYCER